MRYKIETDNHAFAGQTFKSRDAALWALDRAGLVGAGVYTDTAADGAVEVYATAADRANAGDVVATLVPVKEPQAEPAAVEPAPTPKQAEFRRRLAARRQARFDIRAILRDPAQRRTLMVDALVALQAREGRDLTREEVEGVYDAVRTELLDGIEASFTRAVYAAQREAHQIL